MRRFFHPPRRAFPTRAGWFVFIAPFLLGLAAITASNNLLFMLLGASLGAIVVSGILSERNIDGVRTRVRPVGPAYAGEVARLEVTLEKRGGGVGYAFSIHERAHSIWTPWKSWFAKPQEVLAARVPIIDHGRATVIASRRFVERGPGRLARLELSTTFPFALVHKTRDVDVDVEVLVRPRRIPVAPLLADPKSRAGEGEVSHRRGFGFEVYGLRERLEHEDRRRVHARRSLALGREVVLETSSVERPIAWIGVALQGGDPAAIERTLEHAQAALVEWHHRGHALGLCLGPSCYEPGEVSIDGLLDALAAATPAPNETFRRMPSTWLVASGAARPKRSGQVFEVHADGKLARRAS